VLRPADAVEAAECWAIALEHRRGPSTLIFARQALPLVRRAHSDEALSRRGAYVLAEAEGGPRAVTLLATGSEVALALQARSRLQDEGIATAVVSMPCWEIFDEQDAGYRAAVLGLNAVRIGVEAALRFGWDRYLGERGGFVGMTGFGASASAETLYEHFGITAQHVVNEAKRQLSLIDGDAHA
jgi:transketolase